MKKVFRILLAFVLLIVLLNVTAFLYFRTTNSNYLGAANPQNIAYLSENKQVLALDRLEEAAASDLFEADFYDNTVFLLGESHGFADVQKLDQLMLMHLNQKTGLRYYLAEMDSSRANQLNRFLSGPEKDTLLLREVVMAIKERIPQQSSKELFRKWSALYDYNQGLEASRKLYVLGLDKHADDPRTTISRDSIMLLNFMQLVESKGLREEKFWGLFGYSHVLQASINAGGFRPFAAKLKLSGMVPAHKIKSLVCYTLDSEVYLPKNDQFPTPDDEKSALLNADGPIVLVNGINDPREVSQAHSLTLFNLDGEGSPYRTSQLLAGIKVNLFGGDLLPNSSTQATTDFFQYMILIRNSEALSRFE
jgi:hypothetical protein